MNNGLIYGIAEELDISIKGKVKYIPDPTYD